MTARKSPEQRQIEAADRRAASALRLAQRQLESGRPEYALSFVDTAERELLVCVELRAKAGPMPEPPRTHGLRKREDIVRDACAAFDPTFGLRGRPGVYRVVAHRSYVPSLTTSEHVLVWVERELGPGEWGDGTTWDVSALVSIVVSSEDGP